MKTIKAYKFRIYPNKEQEIQIQKTFGCSRFVYNHYLAKKIDLYKLQEKSWSKIDCNNDCNRELKNEFEWLREVDKNAITNSIFTLDQAYQNFFRRVKQGNCKAGFPKFKSKKDNRKSYKTNYTNNNIEILDRHIKLPKLKKVRCKFSRSVQGRILNATTSQNPSGKYFVSICTDYEPQKFSPTGAVVGIDLGIKEFAITSDGNMIANSLNTLPKAQRNLPNYRNSYQEKQLVAVTVIKQELKWQDNTKKYLISEVTSCKNFPHSLSKNMT